MRATEVKPGVRVMTEDGLGTIVSDPLQNGLSFQYVHVQLDNEAKAASWEGGGMYKDFDYPYKKIKVVKE